MNDAVIVSAVRTAVGRAKRGTLATTRPEDMGAAVVRAAIERAPGIEPRQVDDVIVGCAMPEGSQGLNMARIITLRAGFPDTVPAQTINRFCSSGLQSIAIGAQQIMSGMADIIIAGGSESMSSVPMSGFRFRPNPWLVEHRPETYMAVGLTAENVARQFDISREQADEFSCRSHQLALKAIDEGRFRDEIVPLEVESVVFDPNRSTTTTTFDTDEGPRAGSTPEVLAKLKPVFHPEGVVTAGNSSQMSDGAAAVMVMSRAKALEHGLVPRARLVSYAVGGVGPEVMGMGPVVAIPKALARAGLELSDIDLIELNEAFAAQALAVIRAAGLEQSKVNVNGGAIALGHPLGCTGAKLTTQLLFEMRRRSCRYGMVTMCIGGGMGAAGIFENLD